MFFPRKLSPRRACPLCSWGGAQSAAITGPLRGLQVKGVPHKPTALCTSRLRSRTLPGSISGCFPLFNPQSPSLLADSSDPSLSLKKTKTVINVFAFGCAGWAFSGYDGWPTLQLWCAGFSLLWLLLVRDTGSRHRRQNLWHTDARAQSQWLWLPQGMWDLPGPGIKLMFPALVGGFLTTGPQGKSRPVSFMYTTSVSEFFDL